MERGYGEIIGFDGDVRNREPPGVERDGAIDDVRKLGVGRAARSAEES